MARMVRKQIVIEPEQESALARLAEERGVSQSELIRQAVDRMLDEAAVESDKRWHKARLMASFERGCDAPLVDENGFKVWDRELNYDWRGLPRHERDRLREEYIRRGPTRYGPGLSELAERQSDSHLPTDSD